MPERSLEGESTKAARYLKHLEPLQGALEAYCRRSLRDSNAVADVLQSVIANSYRDFDVFVEGSNFRAWIFRYLHLELLGRFQRERRFGQSLPAHELPDEGAHDAMFGESLLERLRDCPESVLDHCDESLAAAVMELSTTERAVLLLRAVGEFKYREIAEILQIPLGTVMSHLTRGRLRVRLRLAEFLHRGDVPYDKTRT